LQVSAIGFGCWEIGGTYGEIDEAQFQQAVQRAVDIGLNCFDTAEAYGMGAFEQELARALGARRKDIYIVTKFGVGYEAAPNRRDSSRQRVMAAIEQSLRRLQTDYVDAHLVYWPDVNTPFEEALRALDDIVQQGKARSIGVSNFRLG
jgi:aryl-alcohol dehydrogenase-like predicted oxidoreductase